MLLTIKHAYSNKGIGRNPSIAECKYPIHHIYFQCNLWKDQMFISRHSSVLLYFSRWLSVGRTSFTVNYYMSEGRRTTTRQTPRSSQQRNSSGLPTSFWRVSFKKKSGQQGRLMGAKAPSRVLYMYPLGAVICWQWQTIYVLHMCKFTFYKKNYIIMRKT